MTLFVQSLESQRPDPSADPLCCPRCGCDHVLGLCVIDNDVRARQLTCQNIACAFVWTDKVPASHSFVLVRST